MLPNSATPSFMQSSRLGLASAAAASAAGEGDRWAWRSGPGRAKHVRRTWWPREVAVRAPL